MRTVVPLKKQIEIIDNTLAARIPAIIPGIMAEYGFDMWIILCREYNEDPIYPTMVPYLCLTARRLSCLWSLPWKKGCSMPITLAAPIAKSPGFMNRPIRISPGINSRSWQILSSEKIPGRLE